MKFKTKRERTDNGPFARRLSEKSQWSIFQIFFLFVKRNYEKS